MLSTKPICIGIVFTYSQMLGKRKEVPEEVPESVVGTTIKRRCTELDKLDKLKLHYPKPAEYDYAAYFLTEEEYYNASCPDGIDELLAKMGKSNITAGAGASTEYGYYLFLCFA